MLEMVEPRRPRRPRLPLLQQLVQQQHLAPQSKQRNKHHVSEMMMRPPTMQITINGYLELSVSRKLDVIVDKHSLAIALGHALVERRECLGHALNLIFCIRDVFPRGHTLPPLQVKSSDRQLARKVLYCRHRRQGRKCVRAVKSEGYRLLARRNILLNIAAHRRS